MDKIQQYEEKKKEFFEKMDRAGISIEEVKKKLAEEEAYSIRYKMEGEAGLVRAFIATVNFYRKYLDKLGNRAKFLTLGVSSATDYGLRQKIQQLRSRYNNPATSDSEKNQMLKEGVVDTNGVPLHTKDTTFFEDKIGKPIDADDEMSQTLIGIVETKEGTQHPAMIRVNGKKACNEKKIMYKWCLISGEQGSSKNHPDMVVLNSREPLMKQISERITMEKYKEFLSTILKTYAFDGNDPNVITKIGDRADFIFLDNVAFTGYENVPHVTTKLIPAKDQTDIGTVSPDTAQTNFIFDGRISNAIDLDLMNGNPESIICCISMKKKKPGEVRGKGEIIGTFTSNPVDNTAVKTDSEFFQQQASIPVHSEIQDARKDDFFDKV